MKSKRMGLLFVFAGCSSTATEGVLLTPPDGTVDVSHAYDQGVDASNPSHDSSSMDSNPGDTSNPADTASPVDTSAQDTASTVDAAHETGAVCTSGAKKCENYKLYQCEANAWQWQQGYQDCCTTNGRFEIAPTGGPWIVKDNQTGLLWTSSGSVTRLESACDYGGLSMLPKLDSGTWRVPTLAELQNIVIGKADEINGKYYPVCDPALDHKAPPGYVANIAGSSTPASSGKFWGINIHTGHPVEIDPTLVKDAICVH